MAALATADGPSTASSSRSTGTSTPTCEPPSPTGVGSLGWPGCGSWSSGWTCATAETGAALPARPGRLAFRSVTDDAEVLAVVRGTVEGTLDAHARRDVARLGTDAAARAIVQELPGPRSLVRLAYDRAGRCVGITVPGLRPWGPDISYVGVLPEHRGNGFADELLLEASHLLVEGGATEIVAAADVGNAPMAAAFARCGYVVVDRLLVHV